MHKIFVISYGISIVGCLVGFCTKDYPKTQQVIKGAVAGTILIFIVSGIMTFLNY